MTTLTEVHLPDIGDFDAVEVIEVLVAEGDTVAAEDSLITLESDKATMEIPSPADGKVAGLEVSVGDKVAEGALILVLEVDESTAETDETPAQEPETRASEPAAESGSTEAPASAPVSAPATFDKGDMHAEVLVLGSGPGGYTAAFRAADLGRQVIMVERHERIGGVCLNVGCIPSKALLHNAAVINEADEMGEHGVKFGKPKIDLKKIRGWKDDVVQRLTGGLKMLAKQRKV